MLNLLNKSIKPTVNGFTSKAAAIRHLRKTDTRYALYFAKTAATLKSTKTGKWLR